MSMPNIRFRPFVSFSGVYDTGLANVAVTDRGELASASSYGARASWGLSGTHSWKKTLLGIDYTGGYSTYVGSSQNSIDQSFLLGLTQKLTRHIQLSVRQSVGIFTRDFRMAGLSDTVPFDPSESYIPTTDYFDNRTTYSTTQANLTYQRTARLSFNFGGDAFLNLRRSAALSDARGQSAHGDAHYRLSRSVTVGGTYAYHHYGFSRIGGGSDAHIFAGSFSARPTRRFEFSATAGVARLESKFTQTSAVDPAIAALIGVTVSSQIIHQLSYRPHVTARVSRTFRTGVLYASGGMSISAGNGLFLTSYSKAITAGYSYTGVRRWSLSSQAGYNLSSTATDYHGNYGTMTASWSAARRITRSMHWTSTYSLRKYGSSDFNKYNRLIYSVSVGVGFTPGDFPLRFW